MNINQKLSVRNRTILSNKINKYIVIHYVGAVSTAANNASFFYSTYRGASANYFVDDISIWQVVADKNAAWHCGDKKKSGNGASFYGKCTNSNSIGIEMCCKRDSNGSLYITDATIKNTAELVQHLMKKYNIPASCVIRHYDVTNKSCPAPYVNSAKWKTLHATLTVGGSAVSTTVTTATTAVKKLTVDGSWGKSTTVATQKVLSCSSLDGIVSNQPYSNKKYLTNAYIGSWKFKTSKYEGGSAMVKAVQKLVGVTADGFCGKKTVIAMQKFLNKKGFSCGAADGYMGAKTVKAWQRYINSRLK